MDRKAVGFYAVAATASLGVLLSAGCGTDSAQPARMAQRETRSSASTPVVVVSPEPNFFGPERTSVNATGLETPAGEATADVTQIGDPYAEAAVTEQLASEPQVVAEPADSASGVEVASDAVTDISARSIETDDLEPVATELASTVELRFSEGESPAEVSDAEKTISVNVGPYGKSTAPRSEASRFASGKERRPLQPLVVTPRQIPGGPTPAAQAKVEPPVTLPEAASPAVVAVAPEPTPAKLAPKKPTVAVSEPVVASKLMPAPVAVAAKQPKPAAAPVPLKTEQPQPATPAVEAVTPAPPAAEVVVAEPKVAEPEPTTAVVESAPPAVQQEVVQAEPVVPATPIANALTAEMSKPEPVAPSPSTLRMAEVQIAPEPEPVAAAAPVVAAPKPAEVAATPPEPKVPLPSATVETTPAPIAATAQVPVESQTVAQQQPAKNQPEPVKPALEPVIAQAAIPVAPQPAPVAPAPVQPVAVQAAPVQPQPIAAMPTLPAPAVRSPAMVASLAQADERVRHAIQLAEKGAMYASRKEFTSALTLISQARDVEFGTRQYSQATAAGLQALKEATDFVKPNAATADISRVVAGHKTPILKNLDVSDLPPSLAAQHYYDYAKVQLAGGIGRETVGSIALYGLGRIIVAGAGANAQQMEYTGPAMALYQAALICEPQNFRAAHELGVLLASTGQLELARNMLLGSASASPQPMMWKNLAVVHSRLGEAQLAAEAQQKAAVLEQTSPNANTPAVKWVDPVTFSQIGSASDPTLPPNTVKPATASPAEAVPAKKPSNVARSRSEWDPLNLRR